jgi:hypothetical protein
MPTRSPSSLLPGGVVSPACRPAVQDVLRPPDTRRRGDLSPQRRRRWRDSALGRGTVRRHGDADGSNQPSHELFTALGTMAGRQELSICDGSTPIWCQCFVPTGSAAWQPGRATVHELVVAPQIWPCRRGIN